MRPNDWNNLVLKLAMLDTPTLVGLVLYFASQTYTEEAISEVITDAMTELQEEAQ